MNSYLKALLLALLCLGPVAWTQPHERMTQTGDPPSLNVEIVKTWNLGVYPGGTWVNTTDSTTLDLRWAREMSPTKTPASSKLTLLACLYSVRSRANGSTWALSAA